MAKIIFGLWKNRLNNNQENLNENYFQSEEKIEEKNGFKIKYLNIDIFFLFPYLLFISSRIIKNFYKIII